MSLTIVVLTQDVEDLIEDCLSSAQWADELLVVDGGSRDGTLKIAERYATRILNQPWPGVSNLQWRYGITQAKGPWVLLFSSDMRIPEATRQALQQAIASDEYQGFRIPLKNHFLGRWIRYCGWWPDHQLLLFRKDCGSLESREHGMVHVQGTTGLLSEPLIHFAHRSVESAIRKTNRYTDAELKDWDLQGKVTAWKVASVMLRNFKKTYWKLKGYRDGIHGLVFCGLMAFYKFALFAKVWERDQPKTKEIDPVEVACARPQLPDVSAVILAKDEEARIARCLSSVAWAGESIVVDGMSQDRTVEVARTNGARVLSRPFSGSFAQERNAGADVARGKWVLQLDADDIVSEDFRQALAKILEQPGTYERFKFERRSVLLGRKMRYGGWAHYIPNFYMRGRAHYVGLVHERLEASGGIGVIKAPIHHHAMESLSPYLDKQNRYTTLSARELLNTRGKIPLKEVRYHLTRRPLKVFWKSYIKKQGWRDGSHGFILGILYAWVHFITWAKYWEFAYAQAETNRCIDAPGN